MRFTKTSESRHLHTHSLLYTTPSFLTQSQLCLDLSKSPEPSPGALPFVLKGLSRSHFPGAPVQSLGLNPSVVASGKKSKVQKQPPLAQAFSPAGRSCLVQPLSTWPCPHCTCLHLQDSCPWL